MHCILDPEREYGSDAITMERDIRCVKDNLELLPSNIRGSTLEKSDSCCGILRVASLQTVKEALWLQLKVQGSAVSTLWLHILAFDRHVHIAFLIPEFLFMLENRETSCLEMCVD